MAIIDQNGILAGALPPYSLNKNGPATVVGRFMSLFYSAGMPGAAVAPTPGISGAALTTYAGQIPFTNPASGETRLTLAACAANVAGTLFIFDRLWHNSGISATLTTAQTINSVAWPARDRNGSTNGDGIQMALEVSGVMGAGTPTCTLSYTDSAGNAGNTSVSPALPSAMTAGSMILLPLAAGDVGVRSVQTLQWSATMISGTIHLVAVRQLAMIPVLAGGLMGALNALQMGFPKLYDNTVPFLVWLPATTTAPTIFGMIGESQG